MVSESLDFIPVTRVAPMGAASSGKHKKQLSGNKELSSLPIKQEQAIDGTMDDVGLQDDSSPMPSSVPNFLSKTYEIVNVSLKVNGEK